MTSVINTAYNLEFNLSNVFPATSFQPPANSLLAVALILMVPVYTGHYLGLMIAFSKDYSQPHSIFVSVFFDRIGRTWSLILLTLSFIDVSIA